MKSQLRGQGLVLAESVENGSNLKALVQMLTARVRMNKRTKTKRDWVVVIFDVYVQQAQVQAGC